MQEHEDGAQFICPGFDLIIALVVPDSQALKSSVANTKWLLKKAFRGSYASVLEEQFVKIRDLGGVP